MFELCCAQMYYFFAVAFVSQRLDLMVFGSAFLWFTGFMNYINSSPYLSLSKQFILRLNKTVKKKNYALKTREIASIQIFTLLQAP